VGGREGGREESESSTREQQREKGTHSHIYIYIPPSPLTSSPTHPLIQNTKHNTLLNSPLARSFLFSRLAFLFELAVNFIKAHRSLMLDIDKIVGAGPAALKLHQEMEQEIADAEATIEQYLPLFPDTFNSVKTELAASVVGTTTHTHIYTHTHTHTQMLNYFGFL
jgi:hypothetical protein